MSMLICVRYPRRENWPQNKMVRGFSTVMDILPTMLDLAGVSHPVPLGAKEGSFHGRTVRSLRGRSWVPTLEGGDTNIQDSESFHGSETFMGWELSGRAALRKGSWKVSHGRSRAEHVRSPTCPKLRLGTIRGNCTTSPPIQASGWTFPPSIPTSTKSS